MASEPMTAKQADYLRVLCGRHGETFDPDVDKYEAADWIKRLAGTGRKLTRADVRSVACPKCGAPAEEFCRRANRGARQTNHLERVSAARGKVGEPYIGGNQGGDHGTESDPFGRDRMTKAQAKFLRSLCEKYGVSFDEGLSRADARAEIARLVALSDDGGDDAGRDAY